MELKPQYGRRCVFSIKSSNRTFMELKHVRRALHTTSIYRSNRTFMELKQVKPAYNSRVPGVLIVPLWNWNKQFKLGQVNVGRSNRTFMELKPRNVTRIGKSRAF